MRDHFREQIADSDEFGSPFSARLLERMAEDLDADGVVAELVADWPRHPRADAVAIRLIGALHAAVLTGRDASLSAEYPGTRSDWDMSALWPLARDFLVRERAWVKRFIASPPQTNEVRRSIALLLPFLRFARELRCPLDLYELGASAGLNLLWDRFRYRTASWSWAARTSPRTTPPAWRSTPSGMDLRRRSMRRSACAPARPAISVRSTSPIRRSASVCASLRLGGSARAPRPFRRGHSAGARCGRARGSRGRCAVAAAQARHPRTRKLWRNRLPLGLHAIRASCEA